MQQRNCKIIDLCRLYDVCTNVLVYVYKLDLNATKYKCLCLINYKNPILARIHWCNIALMIQVILGNNTLYGSSLRNALKLSVFLLHFLSKFEKNKSFSCIHFDFKIRFSSLSVRVFRMIRITIAV